MCRDLYHFFNSCAAVSNAQYLKQPYIYSSDEPGFKKSGSGFWKWPLKNVMG